MKVILLGDLHNGARGGDLDFADYFNRFFTEVLYPYMDDNGIEHIIQAGDYFDNQTSLDLAAWERCKPVWVDQLVSKNYKMVILIGNHDISYRNTLRVNSPTLALSDVQNIQIIDKPMSICFGQDDYSFDIVPWICRENKEEIESFIKKQESPVLIGHFAIEGFPMYRGGMIDKKGLKQSLFENYPFVFSGHFHTKSSSKNIEYLGTPYEITWSDYGDPKGFTVFDTETQTYEFIVNPITMFEKIKYEEGMNVSDLDVDGKIVKLIVEDRGNIKKYNTFVERLKARPLKDLVISENVNDTSEVSNIDMTKIDWVSNTKDYIKEVVDATETDLDKDVMKEYLEKLYERAIAL